MKIAEMRAGWRFMGFWERAALVAAVLAVLLLVALGCDGPAKQDDGFRDPARSIEAGPVVADATDDAPAATQGATEGNDTATEVQPPASRRGNDLNRQSILFLLNLDGPSPDPWAIIRECRRMGFGGVLFASGLWLDQTGGPPYDVPRVMWPGGRTEAADYFRAFRRAGIRIGAHVYLHRPPGGYTNIAAHVAAVAELYEQLGLTQILYADGAESALKLGPLNWSIGRVCEMFLDRLYVPPQVIQASSCPPFWTDGITRGGQTDYHWRFTSRVREARATIEQAARDAAQYGFAGDGGWLTDTVPGGDGTIRPLSPIEIDTFWAWALGHDVSITLRTTQAGLRIANYGDSVCRPMWLLEQLRRMGGGGEQWAYLREPMQGDQWGWMFVPGANPPVIAAYEVPYPARCDPRLHMFSGELGDDRVVMVWGDEPMSIEFDIAQACVEARLLRVMDYRGRIVPTTRTPAGHDRLTIGRERLWMVAGPKRELSRYELNIPMRFLEVVEE